MSKPLFSCEVPGRPIAQGRMRHTKKGRGYYDSASKAHRKVLVDFMYWVGVGRAGRAPIDQPCRVAIEIAGAHRGTDTDNHAKMVLDALVEAGVLAKDSLMVVRELVVRVVGGSPRTVVVIEGMEANA